MRADLIGAMVAFPAQYGASGIMTFIVSHDGVVCQKDVGPDTRDERGSDEGVRSRLALDDAIARSERGKASGLAGRSSPGEVGLGTMSSRMMGKAQ